MANRFLGEASAKIGGQSYTLRCDFNAMCSFEDETGENALAVFEQFETASISVGHMRAMMWAFLQHHHPETTLKEAGALMSENVDCLMDVIKAASPAADEAETLGNGRKPAAKKKRTAA